MTKEAIQNLIAEGELKKAIEHLLGLTKNKSDHANTHNDLLLNSSRLTVLDKQRNQGTIDLGQELMTKNQVAVAILELLNQLDVDFWTAPASSSSSLEDLRTAPLLLDFVKKHGDAYDHDHALFTEFSEAVKRTFGQVKERDMLRVLGEVYTAYQEIPKLADVFVAKNQGKWKTSQWVDFKEEIFEKYGDVLSVQDLAGLVEEKKKWYPVLKDFVYIKGGQFMMGAPESDPTALSFEKPQHGVRVSDFHLGKFTIILGQFAEFIAATGYQTDADKKGESDVCKDSNWQNQAGVNWRYDIQGKEQNDLQHPVIHVSRNDAINFCNYWNEKLGLKPSYDAKGNLLNTEGKITTDLRQVYGFRLPSEAEWEYACRAGTSTLYYTGDQLSLEQANFNKHLGRTQPVGSYAPNPWGLYDMHGNVWEWCQDIYDADFYEKCKKQGQVSNPLNVQNDATQVLRGGGWYNYVRHCRSSNRLVIKPAHDFNIGFRVAFVPPPGTWTAHSTSS